MTAWFLRGGLYRERRVCWHPSGWALVKDRRQLIHKGRKP